MVRDTKIKVLGCGERYCMASGQRIQKKTGTEYSVPFHSIPFWVLATTAEWRCIPRISSTIYLQSISSPLRCIPSGNSTVSLANRSQFRCIPSGSSTTAGQSFTVTMHAIPAGERDDRYAFPGEGRLYGWAIVHLYDAFPAEGQVYTAGQSFAMTVHSHCKEGRYCWSMMSARSLIEHTLIEFLRTLTISN